MAQKILTPYSSTPWMGMNGPGQSTEGNDLEGILPPTQSNMWDVPTAPPSSAVEMSQSNPQPNGDLFGVQSLNNFISTPTRKTAAEIKAEREAAMGDMNDPSNPFAQQKKSQDTERMMTLARAQNINPQLDLTPLMALTDAWSQKNPGFTQSYKPQDNQANADAVTSAQAGLEKQQGQMASEVSKAVQAARDQSLAKQQLGLQRLAMMGDRMQMGANNQYSHELGGIEQQISNSDRITHVLDLIGNGDLKSNNVMRADLSAALASMMAGKAATVYGMSGAELKSSYANMQDLKNKILGESESTIPAAQLIQLRKDIEALRGAYGTTYQTKFNNFIKGMPAQVRPGLTARNQGFLKDSYGNSVPVSNFSALHKSTAAFPGAPAVGTVDEGHQYLGGDPHNPSSWKVVQ